ncbi:copper resistance protein NlpE [Sphingobacterium sp. SGG-5]|uniref:copper resistance protein NlpE n=1 Tax=Sphingobacterium sp. SGG-5 TaxID=2710881 RepID=UPI0013ED4601|nr:copper resistance protein NlpE [Sphingobacterium sp. SGG-5]NGM62904.1 copper resistance protein NlpE [Sphingobacterium sp. SGG-5]
MRVGFFISIVVLSFIFTWACINNQKTSDVKERSDNMEMLSANVIGEYLGSLPCVDCEAINTLLEVRRDNSYKLTYTYEGKSDDTFVKQGFWKINKNRLILHGVDYRYKITDDKLFQLDLAGNEITGDLADKYELARIK